MKIYKGLFFKPDEWADIIQFTIKCKFDPWLDIFDLFGVEILRSNINGIYGIKLQASVLKNIEVYEQLSSLQLKKLRLIINISGFSITELIELVPIYEKLGAAELILQIGFQAYPTEISDSGLNKITELSSHFDHPICFADHVNALDEFAAILPVLAVNSGCAYVEKHIALDRSSAKFDHYSSFEPEEIGLLFRLLKKLADARNKKFISKAEENYLESTNQAPVLKCNLDSGSVVTEKDLIFRRTSQKNGLSQQDIKTLRSEGAVLKIAKSTHSILKPTDFKSGKIGVIIGCRLKSTRLRDKALLTIGGIASIERCINNCNLMNQAGIIVLATSNLSSDDALEKFDGRGANLFRGDPDDVIRRYVDAAHHYDIDHIIRVTGDCPAVSPEICDVLLKSHLENGADYSATDDCSVGLACEIYSTSSLSRVLEYFKVAKHAEYMTWYLRNNSHVFNINIVSMNNFTEKRYRLTLDYEEDLMMFNELYQKLDNAKMSATSENLYKIFTESPEISRINSGILQKYDVDTELVQLLDNETRMKP